MPLFKTIPVPEGMIGVWELSEKSADLYPDFSAEELAEPAFLQYTHEKRKVEWMATRILLKQLIGADFTISYSETGKPTLNHHRFKHLSISHSHNFAALIVHEHLDVGLDVEDMTRNFTAIEKRYLSESELKQVDRAPKLQCLYWCAKEAIFKLVPNIGVEFREQILVLPFDPETQNQFAVRFISDEKQTEYQLQFNIFSNHCLVWVTAQNTE